jgi:hypothetical protein
LYTRLSSVAFNSDSNWSTDSAQVEKVAQFAAESVAHITAEDLDQFAPERVAHFAAESVAGLLRNMQFLSKTPLHSALKTVFPEFKTYNALCG